jgi:hypothetical protein
LLIIYKKNAHPFRRAGKSDALEQCHVCPPEHLMQVSRPLYNR